MIINWLVFSDLHFQYSNFQSEILREKLLETINGKQQEFILFAGDCFYQYNKNKNTKTTIDFIHSIVSATACGKSNVYITPGNHDLIRTGLRLNMLSYFTGIDYNSGEKKDSTKELTSEGYKALVSEDAFSGFFELCNEVIGRNYESLPQIYEFENYRILNINTCILSGGYYTGTDEIKKSKHFDEENLSVLDEAFVKKVREIPDDDKLNIAFMHHGVRYFRREEQEVFQQLMEDSHIDVIFTGHSHKIGIYGYDNTKRKIEEFTCGAPIKDNYSEPSFFECTFDTDSKMFTCKLYSYSNSGNWEILNNSSVRRFKQGIYEFIPERLVKNIKAINENNKKFQISYKSPISDHFNKFGIIDALPLRDFIQLRNKLILEAKGNIILAGQSLENAFDVRKDSESIVESIKHNKNIKNIDVFLTDPIMFDTSTEIHEGDTPISRIDKTIHTILYDISYSLDEDQTINIYFIPLVQLDHMVFVNDILLLRHTLLWTNNNQYKATPLVCKKIDNQNVSESIVKSSMFNVYYEYITKLKEDSMVIDIQEKGYDRQKETLAKKRHRQWRHKLYILRNAGKLKGKITMHKLYRTQLISDLHSSWDPRFRTFSSEINWADESETSSFNTGKVTKIYTHDDLYNPQNLLNDSTQKILLPYVKQTEVLLNNLVKRYDTEALARIYPSLDIGIPNNVLRLAGGFATGMLVVWKCGTPIVPVDTTVNVCSSSYYQFDPLALKGISISEFFNEKKINEIINEGSKKEGLAFSFNTGNHFLLLCRSKKNNMYYLVLHSSAKQFKDTYLGLYPKPNNWYSGYIKEYTDGVSGRYIRYLKDNEAKQFIAIAKMLNRENEDIHNWFANKFCQGISFINKRTYHHYGMPTDYSIAIGTYVVDNEDVVPIFSRENYPICLFKPDNNMWSIELEGKKKYIIPHGWGQQIKSEYFGDLSKDELDSCKFAIKEGNLVLQNEAGVCLKEFIPNYTERFSENMVEVRKLWEKTEKGEDMLRFSRYLSGTIEDVLEPVALFSKNNEKVKYYE